MAGVRQRRGWDFSGMNVLRQPVPWEYHDVVRRYLRASDLVLDIDPEMVRLAGQDSLATKNVSFRIGSERLGSVPSLFDVFINRHAPFDLAAVAAHLQPGGYFITQQVGERNMACVKAALGQRTGPAPIQSRAIAASGLRPLAFGEYDVEYVVRDIESLVFWLNALDPAHADVDRPLASVVTSSRVLAGNADERGFVTNEHRYLAIAPCAPPR